MSSRRSSPASRQLTESDNSAAHTPSRGQIADQASSEGMQQCLQRPQSQYRPSGPWLQHDQPRASSPKLQVHRSLDAFRDHVERHFGFDRAVEAARIACTELCDLTSFASAKAVIRSLRRDPQHQDHQELRSGYELMVAQAVDQAEALGWVTLTPTKALLSLSPAGLLVVRKHGVVVSAFFAGMRSERDSMFDVGDERRYEAADQLPPADAYFESVIMPARAMILRSPTQQKLGGYAEYGLLAECDGLRGLDLAMWLRACDAVGWLPSEVPQ